MTLFVPSKQLRLSVLYSKLNTPKNAHLNIHYHFSVTISLMNRRYFGELIPNSRTKCSPLKVTDMEYTQPMRGTVMTEAVVSVNPNRFAARQM